MWPFNRNQNTTNLKDKVSPTAVKEYYQAVGSQQSWLTWVLSIAAFIITLLIVLGLFWGGRWAWNRLNSDDKPATTTQEQAASGDQEESAERQGNNNSGSNTPNTTPNTPAPAPQTQPTPAPTTTPQTGGSDLPATGPTSDE